VCNVGSKGIEKETRSQINDYLRRSHLACRITYELYTGQVSPSQKKNNRRRGPGGLKKRIGSTLSKNRRVNSCNEPQKKVPTGNVPYVLTSTLELMIASRDSTAEIGKSDTGELKTSPEGRSRRKPSVIIRNGDCGC